MAKKQPTGSMLTFTDNGQRVIDVFNDDPNIVISKSFDILSKKYGINLRKFVIDDGRRR